MPPPRPTGKTVSKRLGPPKRPLSTEASPQHLEDARPAHDSSSELSILVSMLGGGRERKPQVPTVLRPLTTNHQPAAGHEPGTTNHQPATSHPPPPNNHQPSEAVAFDEVARSLAAAEACVPLLAQSSGLMRIAALDVVKAETARIYPLGERAAHITGYVSETTAEQLETVQTIYRPLMHPQTGAVATDPMQRPTTHQSLNTYEFTPTINGTRRLPPIDHEQ